MKMKPPTGATLFPPFAEGTVFGLARAPLSSSLERRTSLISRLQRCLSRFVLVLDADDFGLRVLMCVPREQGLDTREGRREAGFPTFRSRRWRRAGRWTRIRGCARTINPR